MDNRADRVEHVRDEQRAIDAMYERLDADVIAKRAARERALTAPVEEPGDVYARDHAVATLADGIRQLRSAEHSLCFGRIDRSEHGDSLHIGRIGIRAESGAPLLIDWRAEAARPFYAATMASPMGVRRRRHVRLEGRRVVEVNDEILDGTSPTADDLVGDGPLVSALSAARTGRMREAAATLQAEQDAVVRSPHRGVMVVDGGPGTGKTIVALHRAAYVLYAFPAIADRGVLVFGPNRRFLSYISGVLPSLGENGVDRATLPDLVGAESTRVEPDHVARIKGRAALAEGLSRWVQHRQPHGVPLRVRTVDETVVLDPARVDAGRRHAVDGGPGHNRARELFTEYVVDEVATEVERRISKELVDFEEELEELLGVNLDRYAGGADHDAGRDGADDPAGGWEFDRDSIREQVLDDPAIDRAVARVWPRLRAEDAVRDFLNDSEALSDALPDVPPNEIALLGAGVHDGFSSADLALLDEARVLIDGPPETTYGHIVVDEAQQLTEMQWRMLVRRCPGRSMTVVGDLAQAGPATTLRTWDEALSPFVGDRYAHHRLTVNYRTTTEILAATEPLLARIAPDQRLSRSIRHGEPPRILDVTEEAVDARLDALIARTARDHAGELIGVIATSERSRGLRGRIRESDATVVAAPDARGLEFDTVIVVDPAGIQAASESGLRDLYVAQTRATKRLLSLRLVADATTDAAAGRPRR
ncbi:AAA family ATPase [Galbitalea sp. SE-J8]|uniref:HelD family protein n=1 Tax=Galbitalea sp. SE-J8 TaxID=3054952 RepID=UPI00259CF4E0|nr:AAA family ATPase [Galbitalea sp. SE-J8]MDM4761980.1 AAA family ATPase [Galbitalea sp. SE-J8]